MLQMSDDDSIVDLDIFMQIKESKKSYIREMPNYLSEKALKTLKSIKAFKFLQYPDCINKIGLVEEGPCMLKNKTFY